MPPPKFLLVNIPENEQEHIQHTLRVALPEIVCTTASGHDEAIQIAKRIEPHCAILDVRQDALTLCAELRALPDIAGFPILLLADTNQIEQSKIALQAIKAGAHGILKKPYHKFDTLVTIHSALQIHKTNTNLREINKKLANFGEERSTALRESDGRFQSLFRISANPVLIFEINQDDTAGAFLDVNDSLCRLLAYSRDELLRLTLKDLYEPDRREVVAARFESLVKHGNIYFETILRARDGRRIPVAINARTQKSAERRTVMSIVTDRSIIQLSDAKSNEIEDRHSFLVSETGQFVYDGVLNPFKVTCYGGAINVLGYTPKELEGFTYHQWRKLCHVDDRQQVIDTLIKAIRNVSTYNATYRLQKSSGEWVHVEDRGVALPDEDGKTYRIIGNVRDITTRIETEATRRRLDQELQHSQNLESLGVLAGGIAHDFNNILTAIIGLTDMALTDIDRESKTYDELSEALQAAHRAKELVKQILIFSRQSGATKVPLYLHVLVREVITLLRASFPSNIEIIDRVEVQSGALLANPTQIHQVIMNYCTNAAHAMRKNGGKLEIWVSNTNISEDFSERHPKLRPGQYVTLTVRDNGHGMEPEVLQRIFDPFYSTKGPGEGAGMGLSVVHGIVTGHDGTIITESKPGRGATFHTYFPRISDVAIQIDDSSKPPLAKGEKILMVDDEQMVLFFGMEALTYLGYKVETFSTGEDALTAFRETPEEFDLVITDQAMPKMTGDQLASKILEIRNDIPIILFTGFSEEFPPEWCTKKGIRRLVRKPIVIGELANAIRETLDNKDPSLIHNHNQQSTDVHADHP